MFTIDKLDYELTSRQKGMFYKDGIPKYLRNYIPLPYLLKNMETGKLYLKESKEIGEPKDKIWLDEYKKRKGIKKLHILCFTWETELINHWESYSGDKFGCCVQFDGPKLIEAANAAKTVRYGLINYKRNIQTSKIPKEIDTETLPFTKAWAYRSEYEYRLTSEKLNLLAIPHDCIKRITITSKLDKDTFKYFAKKIKTAYGIEVSRSRLEKQG